jgi:hypothetical protein
MPWLQVIYWIATVSALGLFCFFSFCCHRITA